MLKKIRAWHFINFDFYFIIKEMILNFFVGFKSYMYIHLDHWKATINKSKIQTTFGLHILKKSDNWMDIFNNNDSKLRLWMFKFSRHLVSCIAESNLSRIKRIDRIYKEKYVVSQNTFCLLNLYKVTLSYINWIDFFL